MQDAELRFALMEYFRDQQEQCDRIIKKLESAKENIETEHQIEDLLDWQMNYLQHLQRATKPLLRALDHDLVSGQATTPEASTEDGAAAALEPYEQELVTAYSEQPGNWMRKFRSTSFGAENVNEIWGKGGEPKFTRKEGGIYQLIEAAGICYVFPEPGLRLQESYKRSEGLDYLFEIHVNLADEAAIAVIRPAKMEEAGGRWTVLNKGEIRGRS